jgi:hypothetical protein
MPRLLREKIEEIPLRHQRDEAALHRQVAGVGDGDLAVGDARGERAHLIMRTLQEFVEKPEFTQQLEGRRVDRVPAKIPEEIGVLFQHLHFAPGAREQEPGHDARGAAAGNHEIAFWRHDVASTAVAAKRAKSRPWQPISALRASAMHW